MSILQAHLRLKFTQQTSKTGHPPASDTRCPLPASRQTLQKTPPPHGARLCVRAAAGPSLSF